MKPLLTSLALSLSLLTIPAFAQVEQTEEPDPLQKSGELVEVKGQIIRYQRSMDDETEEVTVSADAQIMLNSKPASLEDLKKGDKLNMTASEGAPNLAMVVRAARVIKDTPPSPPSTKVRPAPMAPMNPVPAPAAPAYPALGITMTDSPGQGFLVVDAQKGSPAEDGGLNTGDFIMAVNRQPLATPEDYLRVIAPLPPGSAVEVVVWRQGQSIKGNFMLAAYPVEDIIAKDPRLPLLAAYTSETPQRNWGLEVVQDRTGVRVTRVYPNTAAAAAGIVPGDYISGIGGTPFTNLDAYNAALATSLALDTVPFQVNRGGQTYDASLNFGTGTGTTQNGNNVPNNPNPIRPTNPNQNSALNPGTAPGAIRPTNPNQNSALPPGETNPGAIRPTNPNQNSANPNNPNFQDPAPTTPQNPGSTATPEGSFGNPNAGTLPGPGANPMNVP